MEIMKKAFILLTITAIVGCNNGSKNKVENKDSVTTQLPKAKDTTIGIVGADRTVIIANNTFSYSFGNVVVTPGTINAGENINANGFEIKNIDAYNFAGVHKNFIIIDNGTGTNKREVLIYDVTKKIQVFKSVYEGDLKIENNKLYYINITTKVLNVKAAIDSFSSANECSTKGCKSSAGFIAYFDFTTLKSTITKDIKCYCEQ
jgi:hypothetical protein